MERRSECASSVWPEWVVAEAVSDSDFCVEQSHSPREGSRGGRAGGRSRSASSSNTGARKQARQTDGSRESGGLGEDVVGRIHFAGIEQCQEGHIRTATSDCCVEIVVSYTCRGDGGGWVARSGVTYHEMCPEEKGRVLSMGEDEGGRPSTEW